MPPRSSKKKEAGLGLRASKLLDRMHVIEDSDSEIQLLEKKKQKKRGRKPKAQKEKARKYAATVDVEDDPDEQHCHPVATGLRRNLARQKTISPAELFKLFKTTANALSEIGGPEDVQKYLENGGFGGNEAVQAIQRHCNTLSNLLQHQQQSSMCQILSEGQVPSTLPLYDQYFVFRGPSRLLYVLKPVDVFRGNVSYSRRKVLGFVQEKGSNLPLMFSLPGWTKCVDDHPRLLDSEFWTAEVMRWGSFHNHKFKKFLFDHYHGKEPGHTYSSHTEPRLMLWYACNVYGALTGIAESIRTQIGALWRLKDMKKDIEAEVVLTEAPCKPCLLFQELIESYTGIKFTITVVPNLGQLKPTKNKQQFKAYPLYASDSEDEEESPLDDGEEEQVEIVEESRSRLAVVIRGKSAATSSSSTTSQKKTKTSFAEYAASMMMNPGQTHQSLVRTKPKKASKRSSYYESDEAEYSPPTRLKTKTQTTHMSTPTRKATHNGMLTPPDSIPFGFDALQRAEKINKEKRKRQHDLDDSPTPTKKSRHIRF